MATKSELENENRIKTYKDLEELKVLWQDIQNKNTPDWGGGKALEYFLLRAFELEGAEVSYPYRIRMAAISAKESQTDLEQIDGVVYVNGMSCLIECKDNEKKRIDFEPIAKLRSQLMRRPSSTIASIFSMTGFTEPAMMLLNFIYPQTILAWEADEIEFCLQNKSFSKGLTEKYRKTVEEGQYKHKIGVTL
jgi:hypothetical protein